MSYIESLLELIRSKKEISESNSIELSLREIADAWGRKVIVEEDSLGGKWEYIRDRNFLRSIVDTIEKLQDEERINFKSIIRDYPHSLADEMLGRKFESISDIKHLSSPQDEIVLEVIQPKFNELYTKHKNLSTEPTPKGKKLDYLIYKDNRGAYYYDGKPIEMRMDSLHYKVFDALYSNQDQEGFLSYEDIEKDLIKRGEVEIEEAELRNKRIRNCLQQQLFRFAKINRKPLINKTSDGKKLIEIIPGKGLKLYNPKV